MTPSNQHSIPAEVEEAFCVLEKRLHPIWEIEGVQATAILRHHFESLFEQLATLLANEKDWSDQARSHYERINELQEQYGAQRATLAKIADLSEGRRGREISEIHRLATHPLASYRAALVVGEWVPRGDLDRLHHEITLITAMLYQAETESEYERVYEYVSALGKRLHESGSNPAKKPT